MSWVATEEASRKFIFWIEQLISDFYSLEIPYGYSEMESSCKRQELDPAPVNNYSLLLTILSTISSRKCHLFFQANSMAACNRACTVEAEFLCRSFLFLGPPTGTEYNCKLYHMDHWSLPEGMDSFLNSNVPTTIADGSRIGNFYENRCERK